MQFLNKIVFASLAAHVLADKSFTLNAKGRDIDTPVTIPGVIKVVLSTNSASEPSPSPSDEPSGTELSASVLGPLTISTSPSPSDEPSTELSASVLEPETISTTESPSPSDEPSTDYSDSIFDPETTTITESSSDVVTITKCDSTVTDCPAEPKPPTISSETNGAAAVQVGAGLIVAAAAALLV